MASFHELKDCLTEVLESKGILGKLKAQIQSEIFSVLDDKDLPKLTSSIPPINLIINELFREYLTYNQYHHTLITFLNESGHPQAPAFDRKFIAEELKLSDVTNDTKGWIGRQGGGGGGNGDRTNSNSNGIGKNHKMPLIYSLCQRPEVKVDHNGNTSLVVKGRDKSFSFKTKRSSANSSNLTSALKDILGNGNQSNVNNTPNTNLNGNLTLNTNLNLNNRGTMTGSGSGPTQTVSDALNSKIIESNLNAAMNSMRSGEENDTNSKFKDAADAAGPAHSGRSENQQYSARQRDDTSLSNTNTNRANSSPPVGTQQLNNMNYQYPGPYTNYSTPGYSYGYMPMGATVPPGPISTGYYGPPTYGYYSGGPGYMPNQSQSQTLAPPDNSNSYNNTMNNNNNSYINSNSSVNQNTNNNINNINDEDADNILVKLRQREKEMRALVKANNIAIKSDNDYGQNLEIPSSLRPKE